MHLRLKNCTIAFSLLFIFLSNCYGEQNTQSFLKEEEKCYSLYRGSDINLAEESLLNFLDTILNYQKNEIKGINYNAALGHVYARLYLIENQKGSIKKAAFYLNKSMESFSSDEYSTEEEKKEAKKRIIEFHYATDCSRSVKWLKCNKIQ